MPANMEQRELAFSEAEGSYAEREATLYNALRALGTRVDRNVVTFVLRVFAATAGAVRPEGCTISYEEIADRTPQGLWCSIRTARRVVERACRLGLVLGDPTSPAGRQGSNQYWIAVLTVVEMAGGICRSRTPRAKPAPSARAQGQADCNCQKPPIGQGQADLNSRKTTAVQGQSLSREHTQPPVGPGQIGHPPGQIGHPGGQFVTPESASKISPQTQLLRQLALIDAESRDDSARNLLSNVPMKPINILPKYQYPNPIQEPRLDGTLAKDLGPPSAAVAVGALLSDSLLAGAIDRAADPRRAKNQIMARIRAIVDDPKMGPSVLGAAADLVILHGVPAADLDHILADVEAKRATGTLLSAGAFFHHKARELAGRHGKPWPGRRAANHGVEK